MNFKVRVTCDFPLDFDILQGECSSPSLLSKCIEDIVPQLHTVDKMKVCVNDIKITVKICRQFITANI